MANMARNGTAGNATFNGFSVFQPALGATLQWLPQIGTPELDDMINAFLPGPASIQDKRAHISMDFFEYSRQTGETIKFYPVTMSATPVTSSPYDSGYASSFNTSPVISEQSSWTQSPVAFAPFEESAAAPRTAAKKSSSASPIDFANHPGMRIMTKDGRDVTNSASRGCKTKEQRDHAHLMRIIKACDACKRKKVRCDPSHRRRTGSQASASPAETKSARKSKKASKPAPAPAAPPPTGSLAADAVMAPEMALFSTPFDVAANADELDDLWSQYVNFDFQQPIAAADDFSFNDFVFDSFTPSSASAGSPSNVFPPSPAVVSDFSTEVSTQDQDPALPYMNPDVALGTNYIDFNLYSPSSSFYDDDPVFFQRDVGSRHSPAAVNGTRGLLQELPQHLPGGSAPSPQSRLSATDQRSEYCEEYLHGCSESDYNSRTRCIAAGSASAQSTSSRSLSAGAENVGSPAAHISQSLVSPSSGTRSGVATSALSISPSIAGNAAGTVQSSGIPSSSIASSSSSQSQSHSHSLIVGATGVYGSQSRQDVFVNNDVAQSSVRLGTVVPVDGQSCSALQQCCDGLTAALTMILAWTLPVRRISAGGDGKEMQQLRLSPLPSLSQLVVSGLVSMFLSQINTNPLNVMVMAITLLSLAPIALQWCVGVAGRKSLQIPKPRAQAGDVQSLVGRKGRNLVRSLGSASFRLR